MENRSTLVPVRRQRTRCGDSASGEVRAIAKRGVSASAPRSPDGIERRRRLLVGAAARCSATISASAAQARSASRSPGPRKARPNARRRAVESLRAHVILARVVGAQRRASVDAQIVCGTSVDVPSSAADRGLQEQDRADERRDRIARAGREAACRRGGRRSAACRAASRSSRNRARSLWVRAPSGSDRDRRPKRRPG